MDYVVQTQRIIDEISLLYGAQQPPRLVLKKYCATCDFQSRCLHIAADRDDLSQLATITPKERTKYNEKGIFTITQLSYGYRPRRRKSSKSHTKHTALPPRQDHKLKALAIKKAQIHVVGAPTLKILGTSVFLDVEGMPDRDFYYLIGLRFERAGACVEHSFWANGPDDERSRSAHKHVGQPRQLHLWKNILPNTLEQPERYWPLSRLFMDLVAGFGIRFGTSATKVGDRR
jgi:predicted RecB family nuclease